MVKIKRYWDEIKNQETFYTGCGWEVQLLSDNGKMYFAWPFRPGDGVSRDERSKARKEVMFKRFRERQLASAVTNRTEFLDVLSRVSDMPEEDFRELAGKYKGFELRNYILTHKLTYAESFASFWRC